MKFYHYLIIGAVIAALIVTSFFVGRRTAPDPEVGVIIDTLRYETERIKVDTLEVVRTDTCWLEVLRVDTVSVYIHDTVQVLVPIRKYVADDEQYHVEVSGYRVNFDLIQVYPRTEYQVQTVKAKPKWGLGIQAGYGMTVAGTQVNLSPFIGVGVQYNLLTW